MYLISQFYPNISKGNMVKVKLNTFNVMRRFQFNAQNSDTVGSDIKSLQPDYIEHKFLCSLKNQIQHIENTISNKIDGEN